MGLSGALAARGEREQTPQVRREADAHLQIETLVRRAMHKNGGFPIQALSAIASLEDALVEIERAIFLQNFLRTRSLDAHDDIVVGDIDDGNEDFLQLFLELCDALQRRRDALMRAEQDLVGSQPQQRAFFGVDAFVVVRQLAGESLGDSGERVLVSSSYDDFLEMFSRHDADERRVRPLASWQEALGLRGEIDRRRSGKRRGHSFVVWRSGAHALAFGVEEDMRAHFHRHAALGGHGEDSAAFSLETALEERHGDRASEVGRVVAGGDVSERS